MRSYVPIVLPQRTKMGPQRSKGVYVDYESPSIICFLEPLTSDFFVAWFVDCHFDEIIFLPLEKDNVPEEWRELMWIVPTMSHLDPRIPQCHKKVQWILDL